MNIPLFYSYSHVDDEFRKQLEIRLELLRRQNIIDGWSDRKIAPGSNWEEDLNFNLQKAQIIILLISPEFLASDYCYETETIFALEQHEKGLASVVPIIIRPCMWKISNFKHLQVLPKDGKPLTLWSNMDEAWLNVSEGIFKLTQKIEDNRKTKIEEKKEIKVEENKGMKIENINYYGGHLQFADKIINTNNGLDETDKELLQDIHENFDSTEDRTILVENLRTLKSGYSGEESKKLSKSMLKSFSDNQTSKAGKEIVNTIINSDIPLIESKKETVEKLIIRFLSTYNDWYFSPLRINKWGARQLGFEAFKNLTSKEIKSTLEKLLKKDKVKVTKSQKGNPIYKLK